jgi:hypothetical protein
MDSSLPGKLRGRGEEVMSKIEIDASRTNVKISAEGGSVVISTLIHAKGILQVTGNT